MSCQLRERRPSNIGVLVRMVTEPHAAQPTYSEIGFTLAKIEPSGYHNDRYEAELGQRTDTFARAVRGPSCRASAARHPSVSEECRDRGGRNRDRDAGNTSAGRSCT